MARLSSASETADIVMACLLDWVAALAGAIGRRYKERHVVSCLGGDRAGANTHIGVRRLPFARPDGRSRSRYRREVLVRRCQGADGRGRARLDAELLENMLQMFLYRARADRQHRGDLAVGLAGRHQGENLALAAGHGQPDEM